MTNSLCAYPREGEKEVKGREEEEEEEEGESESGGRVRWWTVGPHSKAEQLLLRLATTGDVKLPGSARRSQYYKKYGNPNLGPTDLRYIHLILQLCKIILYCMSNFCINCGERIHAFCSQ